MTVLTLVLYYAIVVGLVGGIAFLTARQSVRRSRALTDALIAQTEMRFGHTPPLEPYVPAPLPEPGTPPALQVTIYRHPEADNDELPKIAAAVIKEVSQLEQSYGGEGLDYDEAGSVVESGRVVLRLVPRQTDGHAADRLAAVAEKLNALVRRSRDGAVGRQDADIRARISRELQPHLPSEMIEQVQVAAAP